MARIRSTPSTMTPGAQEALIEAILGTLRGDPQGDQPVIFEVAIGGADYFQVIVVWDRWADLSPDIRNRVVIEAYRRFGAISADAVDAEHLSMILPVTPAQALEMGILPYHVMSSRPRHTPEFREIEPLLKEEGAIPTEQGTELRLPTLEMARAARDRLREQTRDLSPEVHWQISQQVGQTYDY